MQRDWGGEERILQRKGQSGQMWRETPQPGWVGWHARQGWDPGMVNEDKTTEAPSALLMHSEQAPFLASLCLWRPRH